MCLTCGCMDAHKVMGRNMTYENLKEIADGNGKTKIAHGNSHLWINEVS